MNTRNMFLGIATAVLVYVVYSAVIWPLVKPSVAPDAPAPFRRDDAGNSDGFAPDPPGQRSAGESTVGAAGHEVSSASAAPTTGEMILSGGTRDDPITLGGRAGDALEVVLSPTGASIDTIRLTRRNDRGRFVYRARADSEEPVTLVNPLTVAGETARSFATRRLRVKELGGAWRLDDLVWHTNEVGPDRAVFSTTLARRAPAARETRAGTDTAAAGGGVETAADAPLLRVTKEYALVPSQPLVLLSISVANLGVQPLTIELQQDGPLGIPHEGQIQYDAPGVMAAARTPDAGIELSRIVHWEELRKKTAAGDSYRLFAADAPGRALAWAALGNKFFAVFTRPLRVGEGPAPIQSAAAGVLDAEASLHPGDPLSRSDLLVRFATGERVVAPRGQSPLRVDFEVYAGPKDAEVLRSVNPEFVDADKLGYHVFQQNRCTWCVPLWLAQLMTGLLHGIQAVVFNGGLAIVVLVIIVRTLLHPLTVFQQKSMYRMQESMSRLAPKLAEIKERFANDRVRQQQEMMKLYADEGVNPMAGMVGMVPLFVQIPILGALWTALSSDIHLRHAPFDGWWIRDLSAPDALLRFDPPLDVPVLSYIPFLGVIFQGITSLNLLPLLMGVSMWLQQKYMPKPAHLEERLKAAAADKAAGKPPPRPPGGGMTPEEQLRQQQMIAYMMSIMFPLMFYSMPSGLNLYWMATNVFGICESLIIRRQLDAERRRRAEAGDAPAKTKRPPGPIARWLKRLAEHAEELQRKADEVSQRDGSRAGRRSRPEGGDARKRS